MGLMDSIRTRVSTTVSEVRQSVTQAKEAVSGAAQRVEAKAVSAGQQVKSAYESVSAPPPSPSAPPPPTTARPVSSSPIGLRNKIEASIADSVQAPGPSTELVEQAKALKAKHTGMLGVDHKALGAELAELAKHDPAAAAPLLREVMNQLKSHDKDDVAEVFAGQLDAAQLAQVARHPDGQAALRSMRDELLTGVTFAHEKEMAGKLTSAIDQANSTPLPNLKADLPPQTLGVSTTGDSKTGTGKIPKEAWDNPAQLVGALTQNPASGPNAGNTCGPSSMLGSTLMAGPEKAARFLENVGTAHGAKLTSAERTELLAIASRVRNKAASWEDLSRGQALLFKAGNTHGDGDTLVPALNAAPKNRDGSYANLTAADDKELRAMMTQKEAWTDPQAKRLEELFNRATGRSMHMDKVDGGWAPRLEGGLEAYDKGGYGDAEARKLAELGGLRPSGGDDRGKLTELAAKLKPGEALSVRVGGNEDAETSNHFITIGRRDDGTLYVYNSDPAKGDPTLLVGGKGEGTDEFKKQLEAYGLRQPQDPNGKFPPAISYRLD